MFIYNHTKTYERIATFQKTSKTPICNFDKELLTIEEFCQLHSHLDGSELYITENENIMKEIIVKRDGTHITMLEIVDNILRLNIEDHECNYNMDFTLSEIDELQEAISIMKDRLERKMPLKKDNFNCERKTKSITEIIKDAIFLGKDLEITFLNADGTKYDTSTEQKDVNIVSNNEQKLVYGGDIADFPIEVVDRMLECQVEQGNKRDVTVFERDRMSNIKDGGFYFRETKEGETFWVVVIWHRQFDVFFKKYPKQ